MDLRGVPTAFELNGRLVLPRGGAVAYMLSKGYVRSPDNPYVWVANPHDPRYKRPGPRVAPGGIGGVSTDTGGMTFNPTPRQPTFRDPFAGMADPFAPKYTPVPGQGVGVPNGAGGPLLTPPPALNNSPFAPGIGAPGQVAPGFNDPFAAQPIPSAPGAQPPAAVPGAPAAPAAPFAPAPVQPQAQPFVPGQPAAPVQPGVPGQPPAPVPAAPIQADPFSNPAAPAPINPDNLGTFPGDQDRLRRLFLERRMQRQQQEQMIRELQRPVAPLAPNAPAQGVAAGPGEA